MTTQTLLISSIIALSVVSALLYVLLIIIDGKAQTNVGAPRKRLDIFLQQAIGMMAIATAILSIVYFFMEYPPK
jgi:hypothetical protein